MKLLSIDSLHSKNVTFTITNCMGKYIHCFLILSYILLKYIMIAQIKRIKLYVQGNLNVKKGVKIV